MSSVDTDPSTEAPPKEDTGPETASHQVLESQNSNTPEMTIAQILSALTGVPSSIRDISPPNSVDLVRDTSPTFNVESPRDWLAEAHLLKEKILMERRARIANTSRVRPLLAALPPLFIEKMLVPTSPPLEKFELFEKLPRDIRMMIYALMASEPRCIKLFGGYRPGQRNIHPWNSNVDGQSRHPSIVHINNEARQEGLRTTGSAMIVDDSTWILYYRMKHEKLNTSDW
ncbi:hypothetical protein BKA64DRAFT_715134 [Cadophora sp. MPI-SDFR-AT-0126]|nr:hypothetical protein BKA64DRAFT_715134 [Leotiomycetes sp. MPI-SDFR-AT-0126]